MTRRFLLALASGAFAALLGCPANAAATSEQAVLVYFDNYGSTNLDRLFALEARLESAIRAANVGDYDGNEIAQDGTDGTLYMYGPDAEKLFSVVKPILLATPFTSHARVKLRFGPPQDGVKERVVRLGA